MCTMQPRASNENEDIFPTFPEFAGWDMASVLPVWQGGL